ncbi:Uncharacterized protein involved in exopolysaccharide biosynthesis [Devosia crocina]|uniref:Uncharacterized protein involved in exopolysaccharide biosynthesis n=1 Tax=Devosia crocina TaxID=429728 RepID=A0A1I7MZ18_9HYPH|nr:hypothetical protein [Devosia crocina]SFV27690.1 Uncharacterized protein involved in exopolysaccharide biosynthesis [Devosia crocina]
MTHDDLRFYSYLFVRRLPLMTAVGALISAAGLYYVFTLPPVYESAGTILVKSPEISASLLPSGNGDGTLARLQVLQQELLTYDALLDLAGRHDLVPHSGVVSTDKIVSDMRNQISLSPVFFGGNEGALGFSVSFSASEPALAAAVANDLIETILNRDLDERATRASVPVSFFQDEVAKRRADLAAIEGRLQAYKTEHLQALPDTLEFRRLLQINLRDRLLVLEREQSALQSRRSNYLALQRAGALGPGVNLPPEQSQLRDLRQALASQRTIFSEDSQTIQSLKAQIAAAQSELETAAKASDDRTEPRPEDMQLAEMDARLDAIAQERESLQRHDEDLSTSIAATPANEAALSAIEREYDDARTLYTTAATRLADAATGEQIESELKGERLVLMEAARVPQRPSGPRRFLLALGVAAAALVGALASAAIPELLNRRVRRAADIEKAFGIEVIASIPNIPVRPPLRLKLPHLRPLPTVQS